MIKRLLLTTTVLLSLMLTTLPASAQYKFDNVLYGAAYYHEYMPYERLDKDIQMMKDCGISVVRIGESSWGLFEPSDGQFDFAWMDRILDHLDKAGIKVIFGTPTYSIPAWMAKSHPEVLAEYTNGKKAYYGIRQNTDLTNKTFRFYCERIIRKLMERYAKNPAIIGFQVDNDTEARGTNNQDYSDGVVAYVKNEFGNSIDSLNHSWGLNYWGMNIRNWDEYYKRDGVTNPSYKNDWDRYGRKVVADFLNWQADIVSEYKRKDQFITHCFMTAFQNIDQVESFRQMQYPGINIYHSVQDGQDGEDISYGGDFMRTVAKGNYIVTETNAQAIGWDAKSQYPPYDGQLRQNVYSHLSSGANMVEYWHWATLHYGQETYWRGILGQDLEPNRIYNEVKMTSKELQRIGKELVNIKKRNDVAIMFSHDSYHALQYMPYTNGDNYPIHLVYTSLYRQNISTDIVPCDKNWDFSKYKMIVIPPLYVATDALLNKISDFVKNGGTAIVMYKSGYCNEHSAVRSVKSPGPLRKACGLYYQEYSTIGRLSLKDNPFGVKDNNISSIQELLIPETAKPLAYAAHPFFGKWPVITENSYGKGRLVYIGTVPSQDIMDKILRDEAVKLGVISDNTDRFPIIIKSGVNAKGRTLRYVFNYSATPASVSYDFGNGGKELLSDKKIGNGGTINLDAWGVAIIEEQ